MTGLSGNLGSPKPFEYSSYHNSWAPEFARFYNNGLRSPNHGVSSDESTPKRRRRKSKKKHSKSSKRRREHRREGYILQILGLLCFILAAVKSFEPLTGVGFTLVLIGYNKNVRKKSRVGQSEGTAKERNKAHTKKRHGRKETTLAVSKSGNDSDVEWDD